jgi:hypothetical protein
VPRQQEQQLVGLLQLLEQHSGSSSNAAAAQQQPALAGVADVQLSLTSLEEVFLNIAKQVRGPAAGAYANRRFVSQTRSERVRERIAGGMLVLQAG